MTMIRDGDAILLFRKKPTLKAELNIQIEYSHADRQAVRRQRNQAAEHLLDQGLLSGDTEAEVESVTHEVTLFGKE